jgi:hypothetical protein
MLFLLKIQCSEGWNILCHQAQKYLRKYREKVGLPYSTLYVSTCMRAWQRRRIRPSKHRVSSVSENLSTDNG